jgi:hypothetical protein
MINPIEISDFLDYDMVDQNQSSYEFTLGVGWFSDTIGWNMSCAQSFTPTLPILTRLQLLISSTSDYEPTRPFVVAIRDDLEGDDLTVVGVSPDEITENLSWIEFDFDDISVNPGQTYYIISYTSNVSENTYSWGWHSTDVYPNGTCYWRSKVEDEFMDLTSDMAFKTYGMESTSLDIEFIRSGLSLSVTFKNIGDYDAVDITYSMNITGGLLGLINAYIEGEAEMLGSGESLSEELPDLIGFGPLQIQANAIGVNAEGITETRNGFIFFIFIF